MSSERTTLAPGPATAPAAIKNLGWRVTLAAVGINLALGILYSWSVIKKALPESWSATDKFWPYAIACLVFSLIMVPGGRLQDKLGPRLVASVGGLLVGLGMVVASMWFTPIGFIVGFGVLAGSGIGLGYASATPPAVKWFPAARTGMIAGIVVSGFGLASVYTAPLTDWLIKTYEVPKTMMILGLAFLVVVMVLSQLLKAPPKGYVAGPPKAPGAAAAAKKEDFGPGEMLATVQFYLLWFMYACGAGAGLLVIGMLADLADKQAGLKLGFLLVAALAVGNGAGRVAAGTASDKVGRQTTLVACFLIQAVLMVVLSMATKESPLATVPIMAVVSALIGANYGANLALFPSITKDYYGLKNFGVNYGLVFTAWGVGGFVMSMLAGKLLAWYGTYTAACYTASVLLVVAAAVTFLVRPPHAKHAA